MNPRELSTPTHPHDWLSVARFAFLVGVSERTVRRRCEAGQVRARLETTDKGVAWLIHPDEAPSAPPALRPGAAKGAAIDFETGKGNSTPLPVVSSEGADGAATVRTGADSDFLAHVLEENRFLRSALEQRDRDAAEMRAALREALRAQPKQLAAGESNDNGAAQTARIERERAQTGPMGRDGPKPSKGAQIAPEREKPLTLGDIADQLEKQLIEEGRF